MEKPNHTLYYRGHSRANYALLPSIMRKPGWLEHEREMYNAILIECPAEFDKCSTHLDYLVHMQHYGLPTRLLDITRNPLVALYFACAGNPAAQGEVVVFDADNDKTKYPGSDTVSVLASLPLVDNAAQRELALWASDPSMSQEDFNINAQRLLHEVKLEKPAFKDEIIPKEIIDCFFVLPEKRNNRIIKQDGAFIICGLIGKAANPINEYRYREKRKTQIYIVQSKSKRAILAQLAKFSINKAALFPEIADVAEFVRGEY
jgi:hypothetical protein